MHMLLLLKFLIEACFYGMLRCELQQSMIVYAIRENWDLLLMILWENIIWEASTRAPYYSSYLTSYISTSCIPIHRCTIVIWNGIKVYPHFMSMIKIKKFEFFTSSKIVYRRWDERDLNIHLIIIFAYIK